jgi:hypothetical protein
MNDNREWVPVEVIWDEALWAEEPWRGDPHGRVARAVTPPRTGSAYGWPQEWLDDEEDMPEEEWGPAKHLRQDAAGLSKRKRKKLRGQDRGQGR